MLAGGAFGWRLGTLDDIAANAALPLDRLLALVHGAGLDHGKQFFVARPMVRLDLGHLLERDLGLGLSLFFGFLGKLRIHALHLVIFPAYGFFQIGHGVADAV